MFKQDPGVDNSLGLVKINFPSPEGVYMHDTPHKDTFNEDYRFDSSGCVRIQNVRELIVWILQNTPGWSRDQIENEFRDGDRLDVKVADPVPLHWVYITAWATTDGIVNFRNDIYNYDGLDAAVRRGRRPPTSRSRLWPGFGDLAARFRGASRRSVLMAGRGRRYCVRKLAAAHAVFRPEPLPVGCPEVWMIDVPDRTRTGCHRTRFLHRHARREPTPKSPMRSRRSSAASATRSS